MKKILFFMLALVVAWTAAMAADVDLAKAQSVAQSFMSKQVASGRLNAAATSNLKMVKAEPSVFNPAAVDYYIFNADKSYVIVAGDDLAPEILMYGEEGTIDLDDIPPAMQWLLNKYKYQIDGLKAGTLMPNYYSPKATTAVPPLVTANWDQSTPYNNQCPTSGGRRALTGCPATSLAMCYYKWKWPKTFPAVAAISSSSSGGYSAPALGERQADWDNIIDEYTGPTNTSSTSAQKDAVAWLMRYTGQSIPDYMYGYQASGADDPEIYQGVLNMGYTNAQYLKLTDLVQSGWSYGNSSQYYTDAQWNEWMLAELHAGRPIEYLAYDISGGYNVSGHAFNVFGCDTSGKYYVNWGWSGDSNGYCALHNFTTATGATGQSGSFVFKYGEAMIIGIEPPAGAMGPELNVNATSFSFTTAGQSNLITITGSNITSDVTVALNDPDDAFTLNIVGLNTSNSSPMIKGNTTQTIPAASISEDNPVNIIVTLKEGKQGTFNGTMTLSSNEIDPISISLNATAGVEDTGGTASDAYLNIAKYATIDDAGLNNTAKNYVDKIYEYTEYKNDGVAWLTMPVFGAWAGCRYPQSGGVNAGPQKWITSSYTGSPGNNNNNIFNTESWSATDIYLGSSPYFTTKDPRFFGTNATTNVSTAYTITFQVTNTTGIKLYGHNNNNNQLNRYPTRLQIYECQLNADGTLTASTTPISNGNLSNGTSNATVNFSVTNLDPSKYYKVVASATRARLFEIGFQTPLALPETPVIVSADPGSTTADITWVGGANNEFWNIRYRPYVEPEMETTFWDLNTDDQLSGWSILDSDGDGNNWGYGPITEGDYVFVSESWTQESGALSPDNWLISPEITLGGTLKLNAWGIDENYYQEVFCVYVAPTSAIGESTVDLSQFEAVTPNITATATKTEYSFDLSSYSGQGVFAIRHYNCRDMNMLLIDDITVLSPTGSGSQSEWIEVNSVTSPYTITGLTPETTYEVQVQGGNAEYGTSSWTASTLFTTLNGIGVPTNVNADPTATTSDITWTAGENNDGWNLRYRPYVESTMETITWTFPVDGEGYVTIDGWNYIDNDEDGHDWGLMATDGDDNTDPTDACWYSQSFINDVGAVTPDNWLVSPEVQLGGTLKFKAWRSQYEGEVLGVFVYQEGNEYLIQVGQDIRPTDIETEYEFDLSDFNGIGLIVIRHYNCTDGFYVFVDDIELTYPSAQQTDWIYVNDVESPYTITGLTPETTYEVQVQGVDDGGATSAWTPSTLFTTLGIVDATLAEIESEGNVGTIYTISDALVAVYANADAGQLWCKDMSPSINPSYPKKDSQIDYMRDVAGEQEGEWQQNNWVLLQFPEPVDQEDPFRASLISAAENNSIIKAGSLTGRYSDALNYTIDVDASELVIDGTAEYTMNLYCTANFLNSNLNLTPESEGAPGIRHGEHVFFFFMNPKIQEVCEVTYAEWDGEKFVVPASDDSEIPGAFTVDWSYNAGGPMSPAIGTPYRFVAVVQRTPGGFTKAAENNYKVFALDFNATESVITGINDVYMDGNREVVGVEYVNSLGVVSKRPFSGMNIVVTRYSDGTTTSVKKIFK